MDKDLPQLMEITRIAADKDLEIVRQIRNDIAALRSKLKSLDERQSQPDSDVARAIGGDLAWQRWAAGTRERLNRELALATARHIEAKARAQKSQGRFEALSLLADQAKAANRRLALAREQHALAEITLMTEAVKRGR